MRKIDRPTSWCGPLALLLLVCPSDADAGLGRPNLFPRGIAIGGAGFSGLDSPITIYYNPAGMLLTKETALHLGGELVMPLLSYEPLRGAVERSELSAVPAPSLAFSTRFAGRGGRRPMPVAFGLGFYSTFGGPVSFDPQQVSKGTVSSSIMLLEMVAAVAYQVNPLLAVGLTLRIGFGLFDVTTNKRNGVETAPAELSGWGTCVGATLGATFEPRPWLRIGVVYASPMTVDMKGGGKVEVTEGNWRPDSVSLSVPWPQWAALGLTVSPIPTLHLHAGLRWLNWSSFQKLVVDLSVINDVVQKLNLSDGFSAHLGAEWAPHERITLRAGSSFDSSTVPDTAIERQYMDAPKVSLGVGGLLHVWRSLVLELAYELVFAPTREVQDVIRTDVNPVNGAKTQVSVNPAPGRFLIRFHTVGLSARYSF